MENKSNSEEEKKCCPFTSNYCVRNCALYDKRIGCCSIVNIAVKLREIEYKLERMN